ncbi:MAG TPA: hypothetical protein VK503_09925 [Candidatus Bathyarchaeia archaeon]|nr:hypothetical protein [Candidatus Bathyarchaeia archaeon]
MPLKRRVIGIKRQKGRLDEPTNPPPPTTKRLRTIPSENSYCAYKSKQLKRD